MPSPPGPVWGPGPPVPGREGDAEAGLELLEALRLRSQESRLVIAILSQGQTVLLLLRRRVEVRAVVAVG